MSNPNIKALYDDFYTKTLDESKWPDWNGDQTILPAGGLRLGVGSAANAYTVVASSRYDLTGGVAAIEVTSMVAAGGSATAGFYLSDPDTSSLVGWTCDGTSLFAQKKINGGATSTKITLPWNPSVMKYWRVRHVKSSSTLYWETSSDGQSWTTRATDKTLPTLTKMRVELQSGYYDAAHPGSGYFTVRYFNTFTNIDHGPGYLTESFDFFPLVSPLKYNTAYGDFRVLDNGGLPNAFSIVKETVTGGNSLRMQGGLDASGNPIYVAIRTDLKKNIGAMDFSMDMLIENFGTRSPFPVDTDTPRISWRLDPSGTLNYGSRYEISVFSDYILVYRWDATHPTNLGYFGVGTVPGVRYRWRVVQTGLTINLERSLGDFDGSGTALAQTFPLGTITDPSPAPLPAGQVGFVVASAVARVDNLSVLPGVSRPIERTSFKMKARDWGVFTGRGPVTQNPDGSYNPPPAMLDDPTVLDDLETELNYPFRYASWYLDANAPFPLTQNQHWVASGHDIIMSWGPVGVHATDLLAGSIDYYMQSIIDGINALDAKRFLIRLMPEMNGSWAGWSAAFDPITNGVDPANGMNITSYAQFIQVWKYIVNFFRANGGEKVEWIFNVNETDEPRTTNVMDRYWPGENYVDVMAFDAYNWGIGAPFNWREYDEVFRDAYNRLSAIDGNLEIWVCEFASKEPTKSDGKAGFNPVSGNPASLTLTADVANDSMYVRNARYAASQGTPYSAYVNVQAVTEPLFAQLQLVHLNAAGTAVNYSGSGFQQINLAGDTTLALENVILDPSAVGFALQVQFADATMGDQMSLYKAGLFQSATASGTNLLSTDDATLASSAGTWADAYNAAVVWNSRTGAKSPIDPTHDKGAWITSLMEGVIYPRITTLVPFNIDKERDWRFESSTSSLNATIQGFATRNEAQDMTVLDPSTNPLPIPDGWVSSSTSGLVEYMRLEEGDMAPLQIEPSYGGIWLGAYDLGSGAVREDVQVASERNGTFDQTRYRGSKPVSLTLQILPYMNADVPYMIDLVSRWADPRRRPVLVYKPWGQDERRVNLRGATLGRPVALNRRDFFTVQVAFVAYDGYELSTLVKELNITVGNSATVETIGSAESYPVIRLYGPLTNPAIYNDTLDSVDGSAHLVFDSDIPDGQYYEINMRDRTVQLNGFTDQAASRRSELVERRWWSLVEFNNSIRLEADAGSGTATIFWQDTWL